jgi:hypothetical protein
LTVLLGDHLDEFDLLAEKVEKLHVGKLHGLAGEGEALGVRGQAAEGRVAAFALAAVVLI